MTKTTKLRGNRSFVFHHPLEPVDPYFEDSHEGFLSDFVEDVGDRAF
jgi:hypothetical protein